MKPKKSSVTTKSFQDLKLLLEGKSFSFPDRRHSDVEDHDSEPNPKSEE